MVVVLVELLFRRTLFGCRALQTSQLIKSEFFGALATEFVLLFSLLSALRPTHVGQYACLYKLAAGTAAPQYFELRGAASTDEEFDVSANLGHLEPPCLASA